jgi:hypothetical protein
MYGTDDVILALSNDARDTTTVLKFESLVNPDAFILATYILSISLDRVAAPRAENPGIGWVYYVC